MSSSRDDRIVLATRTLAALVVPILTIAFVMLYLFPDRTGDLFAWPIAPQASAMTLGATYLGGAWFFGQVALGSSWQRVTLGFLPVAVFAGILGFATVIHWDRFTHGHPSFALWALLYLSLPIVIPLVWWRNASRDPGAAEAVGPMIPTALRAVVGALGAILVLTSVILVVGPEILIPTWPWRLTALTARVVGAMFALSGLVGVAIARDGRRAAAQSIVQAQAISIVLIVVGLIRAPTGEIGWLSISAWLFIAGMAVVLLANGLAAYRAAVLRGARDRE